MCDYYFVCGVQRNCGWSRHFAMCCTLQKFARCSSSVFIFFSFKWHCKLLIITLLIIRYFYQYYSNCSCLLYVHPFNINPLNLKLHPLNLHLLNLKLHPLNHKLHLSTSASISLTPNYTPSTSTSAPLTSNYTPLVSGVHVRGHQLQGGSIPYQNENLTKHWV